MIPYVYILRFTPTQQYYIGVCTNYMAHPRKLWMTYFTKSTFVHKLIEYYGKDSFEILWTQSYATKEEARELEYKLQTDSKVEFNHLYLNKKNPIKQRKFKMSRRKPPFLG